MWLYSHTDNTNDIPCVHHVSATDMVTYIWLDLNENTLKIVQGQHSHGCYELPASVPYDGELHASVNMLHLELVLDNGGALSGQARCDQASRRLQLMLEFKFGSNEQYEWCCTTCIVMLTKK